MKNKINFHITKYDTEEKLQGTSAGVMVLGIVLSFIQGLYWFFIDMGDVGGSKPSSFFWLAFFKFFVWITVSIFLCYLLHYLLSAFAEHLKLTRSIAHSLSKLNMESATEANEVVVTDEPDPVTETVETTPSIVNTPEQLGTCEMCEKENILVYKCRYENQYGKYTREMCADCMKEYNATRV